MRWIPVAVALLLVACSGPSRKPTLAPQAARPLDASTYAHYLRGQIALFEGRHNEAVTELSKAAALAPEEPSIVSALAEAHYWSGKASAALEALRNARERWPKSSRVWAESGALSLRLGDTRAAKSAYEQAIDLGPGREHEFLSLADICRRRGEIDTARRVLGELLEKHPESAEGHRELAELELKAKKFDASIGSVERAIQIQPYDRRSWALLAMAHHNAGRREPALDALRRPFDRAEGSPRVADELSHHLLDLGAAGLARDLVATLDRDDLELEVRIGLGYQYLRLGALDEALRFAKALESAHPEVTSLVELKARALRGLGRLDEASPLLLAVPRKDPNYPAARAMLAEVTVEMGNAQRAQQILREALRGFPENADLLLTRARVSEKAGQIDDARAQLEALLEQHPNSSRALYALAEFESRRRNFDRAIELVQRRLAMNALDATALNYVGFTLVEKGKSLGRAKTLLLRALALDPDNAFILDSYGWLEFRAGRLSSAEHYLVRAARLMPGEPELVWHLAELRLTQKREGEALDLLRRAHKLALSSDLRQRILERLRELEGT